MATKAGKNVGEEVTLFTISGSKNWYLHYRGVWELLRRLETTASLGHPIPEHKLCVLPQG